MTDEDSNLIQELYGREDQSIKFYKQTIPVGIYHFYISGEIKEARYYAELLNVLKTAEVHDTVILYINSEGGDLFTTIQIISAIEKSSANVITSLDGCAYSAATMIFLAGKKHIISPYCTFMIHNYSGAMVGKGHEISSQLKFTDNFIKTFTNKIYKNFLTQAEINDVINGKDLWMDAVEVEKRLKKMNKNSENKAAL
jgi:ATP-dependent protease ClpP protease subunit